MGGSTIVTVTVADLVESVTDVAVRLTCDPYKKDPDGAVYEVGLPLKVFAGEIVPQSRVTQSDPATDRAQETPLLPESPVTVATKDWLTLHASVAPWGEIETAMRPLLMLIAAEANFDESLAEVAVTVTWPVGAVAGAV